MVISVYARDTTHDERWWLGARAFSLLSFRLLVRYKKVQKRDKGLVVNTPWKKSSKKRRVVKVTHTFRCRRLSFIVSTYADLSSPVFFSPSLLLSRLLNLFLFLSSFFFLVSFIDYLTLCCHSNRHCYLSWVSISLAFARSRKIPIFDYDEEWPIKRSYPYYVRLLWIPNIRSDTRSDDAIRS